MASPMENVGVSPPTILPSWDMGLQTMLDIGIVEKYYHEWRSPTVLVPKPDGSTWFCIDSRKENAASKCDAYTLPRVDEMLVRLEAIKYPRPNRKGLADPFDDLVTRKKHVFHLFRVFGLCRAAVTLQHPMNRVLQHHEQYVVVFIDNIIIYSPAWNKHIRNVTAVLQDLKEDGPMANTAKWMASQEMTYLGYTVGNGKFWPKVSKVQALEQCPIPTTTKKKKYSVS